MTKSIIRFSTQAAALWLLLASLSVQAEETTNDSTHTKVKISGQVRFRWFLEDRHPAPRTETNNFGDLRARINFEARINPWVKTVVQLQSSRVMGEVNRDSVFSGNSATIYAHETSGSLNDSREVSAHLAYIQIDRLFTHGLSLKAGRFDFSIGDGRLYGPAEWDLVGRAFDGVILSESFCKMRLDQIALKIRDNRTFAGESIYGLRALVPTPDLEAFIMYENDRSPVRVGHETFKDEFHRTSTGFYHISGSRNLDWKTQVIYQWGQYHGPRHIDATLVSGEIGLTTTWVRKIRTAAGFDWTTGLTDPDRVQESVRYFSDPYKSYESSRGGFHLFTGIQLWGISDVYLSSSIRIDDKQELTIDAHQFQTSHPRYVQFTSYVDGHPTGIVRLGPSKNLGTELDLEYLCKYVANTRIQISASVFFPSIYYAAMFDPSPIFRAYGTLTVDF